MKFLPVCGLWLTLLSSCTTLSNRRDLYQPTRPLPSPLLKQQSVSVAPVAPTPPPARAPAPVEQSYEAEELPPPTE